MTPSVLVIGAGAIGCLYGAQLAKAGLDVSLISQQLSKDANRDGIGVKKNTFIHIDSPWGTHGFQPKAIYANVQEAPPAEILIVSSKVQDTEKRIAEIQGGLTSRTHSILLLQNGIHIEIPWAHAFPNLTLISGLAFVCCYRITPWHIRHQDYGRLMIGLYPQGNSTTATLLGEHWQHSGVPVKISDNIQEARWKKLLWNAAFNPLSVLTMVKTRKSCLPLKQGKIWLSPS